jgi:hypothetical protein
MKFDLTTHQGVIAEPEFRPELWDFVEYYGLEQIVWNSGGVHAATVLGLNASDASRSRAQTTINEIINSPACFAIVKAADLADDITSEQTATSGTTTTVTKTGAGWTADALIGKVAVFTDGTNGNADESVRQIVTDNTTDTITFSPGFAAACDNTTKFKVYSSALPIALRGFLEAAMATLGYGGAVV